MANRKKKSSAFPIFLISYSVLLIALITFGIWWVWGLLVDYEAGLAEVSAEKIVMEFKTEQLPDMLEHTDIEVSEFESIQTLAGVYSRLIEGKEITYKRKGGEYTAARPVYNMLAGDQIFADFSLKQTGTNGHGFPIWQLDTINFKTDIINTRSQEITVPKGAVLYLNDIEVSRDYMVKEIPISLAQNIGEYVSSVPAYEMYVVNGLIEKPEIRVEAESIDSAQETDNASFYDYAEDPKIAEENEEFLYRVGTNYGGYIINRVSLGTLSKDLIGSAKSLMSDIPAIWAYLYGEQYTYDFTEWNVSNVRKYSDECFSCDMSFILNVHYRQTRLTTYDTKLSCIFIKKDGKWYLADFHVE